MYWIYSSKGIWIVDNPWTPLFGTFGIGSIHQKVSDWYQEVILDMALGLRDIPKLSQVERGSRWFFGG
jgi:hypothetical protein